MHAELTPSYSTIGRPSIDPVLMLRMLILGYVFAIRSERALCREVQVNLAYRAADRRPIVVARDASLRTACSLRSRAGHDLRHGQIRDDQFQVPLDRAVLLLLMIPAIGCTARVPDDAQVPGYEGVRDAPEFWVRLWEHFETTSLQARQPHFSSAQDPK
jgi:hypothetical protein